MTKMMFRKLARRSGVMALCSAALGLVLAFGSAPLVAQGGGGGGRGMMDPQAQLDRLTSQLSLTSDQQPKVKAILEDSQKKMADLRNSGDDFQAMRPKMMAIREDQQTKIKALLTDEQKTKYDAMIQQQNQRMRGGPGGPGGAGGSDNPPPPPPQ